MGECGCGELRPHEVVSVGEQILVVEIYDGCRYCETGLMVTLNLMTKEYADRWGLEPSKSFEPGEEQWGQLNYPLIGVDDLREAVKKLNLNHAIGGDGYESLEDLLEDEGLNLLQTALRIRLAKTAEEDKRLRARQAPNG